MNAATLSKPVIALLPGTKYSEMNDVELVLLCQQKDSRGFEVLMKRHQNLVGGMLRKLAPDWNDTADLSQEVFIRIWKNIDKLQNPKAFKSWTCQIITHLFYDELRKNPRRSPALSLDNAFADEENDAVTRDIADSAAGPEEMMIRKDTTKLVSAAIDTLPDNFKTAMMLRDLEDKTYEEIAQITQSDLGTVKSRIARARAKVQKVLTPDFGSYQKRSA